MMSEFERKEGVISTDLSKDHWYAVEKLGSLKKGGILKITLMDQDIIIYRHSGNELVALEDRCAHRHIPLSRFGRLSSDRLICRYHGWSYDHHGTCTHIPLHPRGVERFSPPPGIRSYPVAAKYGLIWIFPGNAFPVDSS
uniref:Rieske domain-containing protein n=1 Tax=Candidatus Kentrum sp. TC TaxID=2126339 RepID=A0A450YVN5_9GAMM|nr:MAG: hypothetical protein/vanillate O-demethylase monooxygenase subunit [Candidatus Kentron sp. TC]VFK64469.1 MAG: hypothetical protein/vanillate O-demethylase monooxygenase subunit [Candidatus Kentron sp. TC]